MNTYQTQSQAIGVARTLSKHSACTLIVYKAGSCKFIVARPRDGATGEVLGVFRNGYRIEGVEMAAELSSAVQTRSNDSLYAFARARQG
jgi:hypothetical protein